MIATGREDRDATECLRRVWLGGDDTSQWREWRSPVGLVARLFRCHTMGEHMPDTADLRDAFEAAEDQFEQYRASVSSAIDERSAGELSRALDVILPDLVFYEGQAFAAGLGLARLDEGDKPSDVAQWLSRGLVEQQAARRSSDYLAGFASVLARTNQNVPRRREKSE